MAVQLGEVIAGQATAGITEGAKAGVEEGVKEEVRGTVTLDRARKAGFIVGTAVSIVLFSIVQRHRRLRRLDEKLEVVVHEVAANG